MNFLEFKKKMNNNKFKKYLFFKKCLNDYKQFLIDEIIEKISEIGVREFARRYDISASYISDIKNRNRKGSDELLKRFYDG